MRRIHATIFLPGSVTDLAEAARYKRRLGDMELHQFILHHCPLLGWTSNSALLHSRNEGEDRIVVLSYRIERRIVLSIYRTEYRVVSSTVS